MTFIWWRPVGDQEGLAQTRREYLIAHGTTIAPDFLAIRLTPRRNFKRSLLSLLIFPSGKTRTTSPACSRAIACRIALTSALLGLTGKLRNKRMIRPRRGERKSSSLAMKQIGRLQVYWTKTGSATLSWLATISTPPVLGVATAPSFTTGPRYRSIGQTTILRSRMRPAWQSLTNQSISTYLAVRIGAGGQGVGAQWFQGRAPSQGGRDDHSSFSIEDERAYKAQRLQRPSRRRSDPPGLLASKRFLQRSLWKRPSRFR